LRYPNNKGMERWRREWNEHVTRMDADRLFEISRDYIPAGTWSPGSRKEDGLKQKMIKTGGIVYNKEEEEEDVDNGSHVTCAAC
jgi:hypothetical protein